MRTIGLREIVGFRGETILELCLTDCQSFAAPLFRPGFLGDKWPGVDFYVELTSVRGTRPYFFAQVKATSAPFAPTASHLSISAKQQDIDQLLQIPGPTYIFGIHEPTMRVFARAICPGVSARTVRRIPVSHELTSANLQALHDEVRDYWAKSSHKPTASRFL